MKIIGLLISLAAFHAGLFAQTKATETVTLSGRLVGGQMAIGGETTGWMLRYRDEKGPRSIEVAFSKALLERAHDGDNVRLTGTIEERQYLERGKVPTLVAATLEVLPSQ